MRTQARSERGGFTLTELAIVMLIIGLIVAFIASVSFTGIEQARIRATQSLITKLQMGLDERLDALLQMQVTPNGAHQYMAAIAPQGSGSTIPGTTPAQMPWGLPSPQRAQVIAWVDYIKREMPDVFFIQSDTNYPVNFAGRAYPGNRATVVVPAPYFRYILPLGQCVGPPYIPADPPVMQGTLPPGSSIGTGAGIGDYGEGIFGASYTARAALNKLIGYNPAGYDGVDNDVVGNPGFGLVDDWNEGVDATNEDLIRLRLKNHQHVTARSETLYAILVEGQGPLGSVFSPSDFTEREVQDTDGDGLPEFVDAWGSPIQFYRWPIFHETPELQKGSTRYQTITEPRQQFPLDPNRLLVAPAWWGANAGSSTAPSGSVTLFQSFFTCLTDPNYSTSGTNATWDRSATYARRSFFCKYLIVAPGPDQETGLYILPPDTRASSLSQANTITQAIVQGTYSGGLPTIPPAENFAAWVNWAPAPSGTAEMIPPDAAEDNIDNQALQNQAGGVR